MAVMTMAGYASFLDNDLIFTMEAPYLQFVSPVNPVSMAASFELVRCLFVRVFLGD